MVKALALALSLLGAAVALGGAPSSAAAEDPGRQETARRLFEEGVALAQADRWAEALSAFRRSQALVRRASTSYNIANALYRLDRPVQALAELDEYASMPEVRYDAIARRRGEELRALVEKAVGVVRLEVSPEAAMVFVDGRPSVALGAERRLLLDPGNHSLRVTHEGYQSYRREIQVERGAEQTLRVALERTAVSAGSSPIPGLSATSVTTTRGDDPSPPPEPDDRKRFVKRPGFWVMIGVLAAAGIGAGVAVAVIRNDDSPSCGTTGDCATTQGLTVTSF